MAAEAWGFCIDAMSPFPYTRLLSSDASAVLSDMLKHLRKKPFMLYESQLFPPYGTENAFDAEKRTSEQKSQSSRYTIF